MTSIWGDLLRVISCAHIENVYSVIAVGVVFSTCQLDQVG